MVTVSVALLLLPLLAAGFHPLHPHPHPHPHPLHPPLAPAAPEPPQKHFPGSVCPEGTTCVRPEDCSRQCRPGWESFGLSSCYLGRQEATHGAAQTDCAGRGGHLLVFEDPAELAEVAPRGGQWTDGVWDAGQGAWVWSTTGERVDFAALGTATPADGTAAEACLAVEAGPPPSFTPVSCDVPGDYFCETGSSSVARCARKKERICCAVSANHYGEPCYVDEEGTRCEQRIREGYFPLGEGLIRPSESPADEQLSWVDARALCRAEGGDLITVNDREMDQAVLDILSGLQGLAPKEFYIGLSSNADGQYSYVDGTPADFSTAYSNFLLPADRTRPNSCAFYSGLGWAAGDCTAPRDYICHIRRVRHSFRQEPEAPRCGRRQTHGVLAKSGLPFPLPPLPLPGRLPQLGVTDDGRRGAAQFGEIPWQAAVWRRANQADHDFSCSGALVHPAWVLTSAACVEGTEPEDLKVTVGDWNLDEEQPVNRPLPPVALDVTTIRTSPARVSMGPYGPVLGPGRLAMLRITPDLDGDEYPHVGTVCLPDASLLRDIGHLRCVVTGWRGGAQPTHHPWHAGPEPDLRDILRKFETGVRHDPQCQDVAQHLRQVKQIRERPPFPPPFPPPFLGPVPFSADGLEPRSQFGLSSHFGPPPYFGGLPLGPPPPPAEPQQPELFICPRDLRCIPDRGALLACALPPPPPPPHFRPGPGPHPLPLYRSAQNDTAEPAPAAAPAPAPSPAPAGPGDAYEQLSKGFRPPVEKKAEEKRERRSTGAEEASAADTAPKSQTPAEGAKSDPSEASARSAFNFILPHNVIGAFHSAPPPLQQPAFGADPAETQFQPGVQPPPQSTRLYDAYVLVGIASSLTEGCAFGQMIFDDVIQEAEFVQQVLHRDG